MLKTGRRTAAALGALALAALAGWEAATDPASSLLLPAPGARWIVCPRPFQTGTWPEGDVFAYFRLRLVIGTQPSAAVLDLRALRDVSVKVDGRTLLEPRRDVGAWRRPRSVDLASSLTPGEHQLLIVAMNHNGPPALWARARALGLATGPLWQASCDGQVWAPARAAAEVPPLEIPDALPTAARGFAAWLPLLAAALAAAWLGSFPGSVDPRRLKRALLFYWAALAVDSAARLRLGPGFDFVQHVEYFDFILDRGRLPLATDGWQMFQAPLYYLVSAASLAVLKLGLSHDDCLRALRALNMLAGLGLVEVSARFMRRLWPRRPDLQSTGLLIAGLLPMNLTGFQTLGNEPLCALLTAATLLAALAWLEGESPAHRVGGLWGLALLAKVSAALLGPALLAAGLARRRPKDLLAVAGAAALVCGWYYGWVWMRLGAPFVGGWDAARGIVWWQDPGLRTLSSLLSFGTALRQPVYAGIHGVWDSLYSTLWGDGFLSDVVRFSAPPPWRFGLMAAGMWLALIPSGLALAGLWRAAAGRLGRAGRLAALCAAVYGGALLWLFVKLPVYSTAKASYLSGLTAVLGALVAAGVEALPSARARRVAGALLASWAAAAAVAYWP